MEPMKECLIISPAPDACGLVSPRFVHSENFGSAPNTAASKRGSRATIHKRERVGSDSRPDVPSKLQPVEVPWPSESALQRKSRRSCHIHSRLEREGLGSSENRHENDGDDKLYGEHHEMPRTFKADVMDPKVLDLHRAR